MEMDIKNFTSAVTQLAEEKDIPKKKVIEIIEEMCIRDRINPI